MAKPRQKLLYDDAVRGDLEDRLNRIEGQVRGIARMIEAQRPCLEVLQQLASIRAALKGLTKSILRNYLEQCASDVLQSKDPAAYDELLDTLCKFIKE